MLHVPGTVCRPCDATYAICPAAYSLLYLPLLTATAALCNPDSRGMTRGDGRWPLHDAVAILPLWPLFSQELFVRSGDPSRHLGRICHNKVQRGGRKNS